MHVLYSDIYHILGSESTSTMVFLSKFTDGGSATINFWFSLIIFTIRVSQSFFTIGICIRNLQPLKQNKIISLCQYFFE